jgi:hypothetical protein
VASGSAQPIEVRSIGGMERFSGWTAEDGWHTRTGGGLIVYDRTDADGAYTFSVRLDRDGNPFSSARRLSWIVGYIDDRNYVRFQLDRDNFYRTEIVNGRASDTIRTPHQIPTTGSAVRLMVQVSTRRVTHRFSAGGQAWSTFHEWDGLQLRNRRFGFEIERGERVAIADFQFRPAPR